MCGLRFGKEFLRLLVNLEEITPKLGPTFLLSTTSFFRIPFTVLPKHFDPTPGHRPLHCFGESTDDIVLAADTRLQHLNGIDCLAVDDTKADRSIDSKSQAASLSCTRELFRFFHRRLIDHGH
jgi:hypothetical protein